MRPYLGQTCFRHLHFLVLTECAGCQNEQERLKNAVAPPIPVEYPMSRTMEIEHDDQGNIVATPPMDYDG